MLPNYFAAQLVKQYSSRDTLKSVRAIFHWESISLWSPNKIWWELAFDRCYHLFFHSGSFVIETKFMFSDRKKISLTKKFRQKTNRFVRMQIILRRWKMDRSEDFVRVLHQTRPLRVARFAVTNKFTGQLQLSGLE